MSADQNEESRFNNFQEWFYAQDLPIHPGQVAENLAEDAWIHKDVESYKWKRLLVNCYFSWVRGGNQFEAMEAARIALELTTEQVGGPK
jgi:hypothetical protein